jgi:phenylalanyl-tRNA synthetase alpha chain
MSVTLAALRAKLEEICASCLKELDQVRSVDDLLGVRRRYLGKQSQLQESLCVMRTASPKERPELGEIINHYKERLKRACATAEETLAQAQRAQSVSNEKIDVTLPGKRRRMGSRHPLTQTCDKIVDIFVGTGFTVQLGPEIDSDYYNYEGLNFPPDHPARDMQDTFYIDPHTLLRSHTSNVQLRIMEKTSPPIRIVTVGRVYRNETVSARAHVMFSQVEGLYIDEKVSMADLFVTMREFGCAFFGQNVEMRFIPSYFPFVEPGVEVYVECLSCRRAGCRLCKGTGWVEIAGAGMVHPVVLRNGGIDPEKYTGFAWGLGVDRMTMLTYQVPDIRWFTENNLQFLLHHQRT